MAHYVLTLCDTDPPARSPSHHLMHVLVHAHTRVHTETSQSAPWYIPLHVNREPMLSYLDIHEDIIREVDQYSPVNIDKIPQSTDRIQEYIKTLDTMKNGIWPVALVKALLRKSGSP